MSSNMESRKYSKRWEQDPNFKDWIGQVDLVSGDDTKAFCKFCNCILRPHTFDLKLHMKTEKHRKAARSLKGTPIEAEAEMTEQGKKGHDLDKGHSSTSQKLDKGHSSKSHNLEKGHSSTLNLGHSSLSSISALLEPVEVMPITVDTQEQFHQVFKKLEFDSWAEFAATLDEFQRLTGTFFKPKSGSTVEKVNQIRVKHKIPERFRYQTVQMLCQHYGYPRSAPDTKWKRSSYVGLGCGAHFKLSYRQGKLHITHSDLVHSNHTLNPNEKRSSHTPWAIDFTDDLDLLIARTVLEDKAYQKPTSDWSGTTLKLQDADSRLLYVTRRMIKRRMDILLYRYEEDYKFKDVLPHDERGNILKKLWESRKQAKASDSTQAKVNETEDDEEHSYTSRKRRKSFKMKLNSGKEINVKWRKADRLGGIDLDDDDDDASFGVDNNFTDENGTLDQSNLGAMVTLGVAGSSPACPEKASTGGSYHPAGFADIDGFWRYWQKRDVEERKLREAEVKLRAEEMELRRKELELQRQKFELDRKERDVWLQFMTTQSESLNSKLRTQKLELQLRH